MSRRALLALPAAALLAAGCASQDGDFPSLAQRPAEREFAEEQLAPPKVRPPLPDDPAVAERASGFVAAARAGESAFASAYETAAAAAGRAGPAGSDSWTIAQQAVSRAVAAQAPVTRVLGEIADYQAGRGRQTPISPGDVERLQKASAEVQRIADSQAERLRRLEASLSR